MAQAFNRLGGALPKGSGKGIIGGIGALAAIGALGFGINAALFNGKEFGLFGSKHRSAHMLQQGQ
jgi:hypothetical protein